MYPPLYKPIWLPCASEFYSLLRWNALILIHRLKPGTRGWVPAELAASMTVSTGKLKGWIYFTDMHSILLLPHSPSRAKTADCLKQPYWLLAHSEAPRKDWSKCPVTRKEPGLALPLSLLRGIIMNWALELFDGALAPGGCMWAFCSVISSCTWVAQHEACY